MDVKIGRSTFYNLESFPFLLRIFREHDLSLCLPQSAHLLSVMDCNDGRSTSVISFTFIQYFQLLLIRIHEMLHHLM